MPLDEASASAELDGLIRCSPADRVLNAADRGEL
jgi:hypothetical protein